MELAIFGLCFSLLVLWIISAYNRMVKERLRVDNQWSQIDIQLKMRADVLPLLIEAVSGYARHESALLTSIAEARAKYLTAETINDKVKASDGLSASLFRLMAVAEAYPDLKANTNFLSLQKQLADIEKRIADFRQFYNDTVMHYNTYVLSVPQNILAQLMGFTKKSFFEADETVEHTPEITLNK